MTRRRWRQDPVTHELVEITSERDPGRAGDAALWNDRHYENLSTTDGVDISSRTKHRAYKKMTGYEDYDDYRTEFAKRQKERERYMSGERGSVSRRDIERALYELKNR